MRFVLTLFTLLLLQITYGQITVKMTEEGGVYTIPCKINGLPLIFIFDTGASDVSMSLTEVSFMIKNGFLKREDILGAESYLDANGDVKEGITINLKSIKIGTLELKNVRASVVKNIKAPLLLGQSALKKLGMVQIDFEKNMLTLFEPGQFPVNTISKSNEVDTAIQSHSRSGNDAEEFFKIGKEKFDNSEYEDAINYFSKAISINNSEAKYFTLRGLSKDLNGDKRDALVDYTRSLELMPTNAYVLSYRGEIKFDLEDTTGALIDIEKAIKIDKTNIYAYRLYAKIELAKNDYKSAIKIINTAISIDSTDCYCYRLRGNAKYGLKDFPSALKDYDFATKLCPTEYISWGLKARIELENGDYSEALEDIDKSISIDSNFHLPYQLKARIFEEFGKLEEAINFYKKAYSLYSEDYFSKTKIEEVQEKIKLNVWISAYKSAELEIFFKNKIESKEYGVVKIWLKHNQKKFEDTKNGKKIIYNNISMLNLTEIDCKNHKIKTEYNVIYDSKGNVIKSHEYEDPNWEIAPPQSIGDIIISKICEKYF